MQSHIDSFIAKHNPDPEFKDEFIKFFNECLSIVFWEKVQSQPQPKTKNIEVNGLSRRLSATGKPLCNGTTKAGKACKKPAKQDSEFCSQHEVGSSSVSVVSNTTTSSSVNSIAENAEDICKGWYELDDGTINYCNLVGKEVEGALNKYCYRHRKDWEVYEIKEDEDTSSGEQEVQEEQ